MLPAAAARPGLGDFDGAFLALMTVPDLVAGNAREETKTRPVPRRLTDRSGKTRKTRFSLGFHLRNRGGRDRVPRQSGRSEACFEPCPAPHAGLDIHAVPSDISVMTETTDKKK